MRRHLHKDSSGPGAALSAMIVVTKASGHVHEDLQVKPVDLVHIGQHEEACWHHLKKKSCLCHLPS